MALEWKVPEVATASFSVALNENGNIAQESDTAVTQKTLSMQGIAVGANFSNTAKVYSAFVEGLAGGRYDAKSGVKTVKYTAVEE